jgi:hypothetical protein
MMLHLTLGLALILHFAQSLIIPVYRGGTGQGGMLLVASVSIFAFGLCFIAAKYVIARSRLASLQEADLAHLTRFKLCVGLVLLAQFIGPLLFALIPQAISSTILRHASLIAMLGGFVYFVALMAAYLYMLVILSKIWAWAGQDRPPGSQASDAPRPPFAAGPTVNIPFGMLSLLYCFLIGIGALAFYFMAKSGTWGNAGATPMAIVIYAAMASVPVFVFALIGVVAGKGSGNKIASVLAVLVSVALIGAVLFVVGSLGGH